MLPGREQLLGQMAADESGAAGDQVSHLAIIPVRASVGPDLPDRRMVGEPPVRMGPDVRRRLTSGPVPTRLAVNPPSTTKPDSAGRALLAPVAVALLATAALAGLYGTASVAPDSQGEPEASAPARADLDGEVAREVGPGGVTGVWIAASASLTLSQPGSRWVAFRARGRETDRLAVTEGDRVLSDVSVTSAPRGFIAGPTSGAADSELTLETGADAGRSVFGTPRRRTVLVSSVRVSDRPIAALPGRGFWPEEAEAGVSSNWLGSRAEVEIVASSPSATRAWLSFRAESAGSQRTVTVLGASEAQPVRRFEVARSGAASTPSRTVLGPFALTGGRARVALFASPAAKRYGRDPRSISVRLGDLQAYVEKPARED